MSSWYDIIKGILLALICIWRAASIAAKRPCNVSWLAACFLRLCGRQQRKREAEDNHQCAEMAKVAGAGLKMAAKARAYYSSALGREAQCGDARNGVIMYHAPIFRLAICRRLPAKMTRRVSSRRYWHAASAPIAIGLNQPERHSQRNAELWY